MIVNMHVTWQEPDGPPTTIEFYRDPDGEIHVFTKDAGCDGYMRTEAQLDEAIRCVCQLAGGRMSRSAARGLLEAIVD